MATNKKKKKAEIELPKVITSADIEKQRESQLTEKEKSKQLQSVYSRQKGETEEDRMRANLPAELPAIKRTLSPEEEARAQQLPQFQTTIPGQTQVQTELPALGKALIEAPAGMAGSALGLTPEQLGATRPDVQRVATTALATGGALTLAGVPLVESLLGGLGKIGATIKGGIVGGAIGFGISEIKNLFTGEKTTKTINGMAQGATDVLQYLKNGDIDFETAKSQMNEITQQYYALYGTFQNGSREFIATYTEGGFTKQIKLENMKILLASLHSQIDEFGEEQRYARRQMLAYSPRPTGK